MSSREPRFSHKYSNAAAGVDSQCRGKFNRKSNDAGVEAILKRRQTTISTCNWVHFLGRIQPWRSPCGAGTISFRAGKVSLRRYLGLSRLVGRQANTLADFEADTVLSDCRLRGGEEGRVKPPRGAHWSSGELIPRRKL